MPETFLHEHELWSLSFIQPFGEPGDGRQDVFYHIDISTAVAKQMALPGSPSKNMPPTLQDAVDHHCRPRYQIPTESLSGKTFPETKNQVFCRYGVTMIKQMLEASPIPPRSPEDFLPGADEPLSRLDLLLIPSARRGDHPRIRVKESDPDFGWRVEDGQVGGFLTVVEIYGPNGKARLNGGDPSWSSPDSGVCADECQKYVHLPTFEDLVQSLAKLKPKKQAGGGKSGAVPRYSDDGKYIMKKMEGHEERTLGEVAPQLWNYWISPAFTPDLGDGEGGVGFVGGGNSLISRYYAKLEDPSGTRWVLFENVHSPFKTAFVDGNLFKLEKPGESIVVYDIKGGGYGTIGAGPDDDKVPTQMGVSIQSTLRVSCALNKQPTPVGPPGAGSTLTPLSPEENKWCAPIESWRVLHAQMARDTQKLASLGLWDYSMLFTVANRLSVVDWYSNTEAFGDQVIGGGFIDILRPTKPHPSVVEALHGAPLGAIAFREQRLRLAEAWAKNVMNGVIARLLLGSRDLANESLLIHKKSRANIMGEEDDR